MTRADLKKALQQLSYGLYVVGSSTKADRRVSILANWVSQVSFVPPLVAISIEHGSTMHEAILERRSFSVNVLPSGSPQMTRGFLKSHSTDTKSFNGWEFHLAGGGSPFLKDALSCFECTVQSATECGDHTLFVGEVVELEVHRNAPGLTLRETGLNYWKDPS